MKNSIKIELQIDKIHDIVLDIYSQKDLKEIEVEEQEESVDIRVFNLMEALYPDSKVVTQALKDEKVYSYIKSKKGTNRQGKSDVSLFNYFGNRSIDIVIENKFDVKKGNPIDEAIQYCEDINKSGDYVCRVAIGFNPYDEQPLITKVLSAEGKWENLVINGEIVNGFIGQEVLQLIYNYAGMTDFELVEIQEEKFTRNDFRNLLGDKNHKVGLYAKYAYMSDLATNYELKISFTIAFISLKIILEKLEDTGTDIFDESGKKVLWRSESVDGTINTLKTIGDIKAAVDAVVGNNAPDDIRNKYQKIFQLTESMDFNQLIDKIRVTEKKDKPNQQDSTIHQIKKILDGLKRQQNCEYEFDLFGEVYEAFADEKTKQSLGTYFTKRHIIRPIVSMFFRPSDLEAIINEGKTIVDPFCGTGGMLTESFKQIRRYCNGKYPEKNTSEIASKVIYGYDILAINESKTKINMILAEDGYSVIDCRNSLTMLGGKNTDVPLQYDYIITNIPCGDGSKEGIVKNMEDIEIISASNERSQMINRVRNFEKNNTKQKLEYNALIKVVQLLKEGGKAVVIVPDGILENPRDSKLREWFLIKCKMEMVISLPKYAFAPYTKEKMYAVIFQKRRTDDPDKRIDTLSDIDGDEKYYGYIIDNDGYANSDKQYETSLTDEKGRPLHNELSNYYDIYGVFHPSIIEQICKTRKEDTEKHYDEWGREIYGKKYGYIYIRDVLSDFYYSAPEEKDINKIYRLNMIPESYFRKPKYNSLSIQDVNKKRNAIQDSIKKCMEMV